jgi:hypothetical protein
MAHCQQSTWRYRSLAIRATYRSIAASASSANGRRPTPPLTRARLREGLLDKTNTASGVWADTAYRSATNETFIEKNGLVSHVHRKKPKGRPLPEPIRRANAAKSKIRSHVEHIFAEQKDRMELFIRTIGIARARVKIGMANLQLQTLDVPAKNRRPLINGEKTRSHGRGNRKQKSRAILTPRSTPYQSATVNASLIEVSSFLVHGQRSSGAQLSLAQC